MEAVLIGAGLVLALYGFLRARRADESGRGRRRRARPDSRPTGADAAGVDPGADPREQAMAVLRQPLNFDPDGWGGLAGASPLKQFRFGTVFGLGIGLALGGVAMMLFTMLTGPGSGTAAPEDTQPPAASSDPSPTVTLPPEQPGAGTDQPGGGGVTTAGTSSGTGGGTSSGTGGGTSGGTGGGTTGGTGGGTTDGTGTTAPLPVTFNVKSGENAYQIATQLKEMNIIQSDDAFISRLVERKLDTRLQAGRFQLSTGMTLDQVIDVLAGVG